VTKRYKLEADKLDKWLAQLRNPESKQLTKRFFDCATFELAGDYLHRVRRQGLPVCGCALGHYAAATVDEPISTMPNFLSDLDRNLRDMVFHMNDDEMMSLTEIADWLEANVERV